MLNTARRTNIVLTVVSSLIFFSFLFSKAKDDKHVLTFLLILSTSCLQSNLAAPAADATRFVARFFKGDTRVDSSSFFSRALTIINTNVLAHRLCTRLHRVIPVRAYARREKSNDFIQRHRACNYPQAATREETATLWRLAAPR